MYTSLIKHESVTNELGLPVAFNIHFNGALILDINNMMVKRMCYIV